MVFAFVQRWFRMSNQIILLDIIQQRCGRLKFYDNYNIEVRTCILHVKVVSIYIRELKRI